MIQCCNTLLQNRVFGLRFECLPGNCPSRSRRKRGIESPHLSILRVLAPHRRYIGDNTFVVIENGAMLTR